MRPLKITQLMLSKGFGGAERYFVDLALTLAETGHEVQAICHRRFSDIDRLRSCAGLTLETVNARGMWDLWSLRRLVSLTEGFAPDVLHAHLSRGAWAGSHIVRRCRVPLIVKTHNYVKLKYYTGVDAFIPTTRDQERYLLDHGVAPEKIVLIPNFSSIPAVTEMPPLDGQPLRFLSYGRMVEKKGFRVLLEAFRALRAEGVEASLMIGGEGPLRKQLERFAHELGVGDSVRFLGWIRDVRSALEKSDVFVLPSLDEPFGIVLLEAMATGRAIVSTRTAGPIEIVDSQCAWLADVGDVASLTGAMREVAADREERRRRAAAGLDRYRSHYHRDAVVPRLVALYRRLAAGGQSIGLQ